MPQVELVKAFKDGNVVVALGELQDGDTFAIRGDGVTGGGITLYDPTNTYTTNLVAGSLTADNIVALPTGTGNPGDLVVTDGAGNLAYTGTPTFENLTLPNIQIAVTDTQTIDTTAGDLMLGSATGAVQINNTLTVNGNTTVQGNLFVQGTTTTVNSTTVEVVDPVLSLGQNAAQDNLDRGIELLTHNGVDPKLYFMGWDDSKSSFVLLQDATNSGEVFSGTAAPLEVGASTFFGNAIPSANTTYDLGTPSAKWNNIYAATLNAPQIDTGVIQISVTDPNTIDTSAGALNLNSFTGIINLNSTQTNVMGALTTAGNFIASTDASVVANATVGGTLGVTGDTTLGSALGVTGAATLSDTLSVTNGTTLLSTLNVTGAATLSDTLSVTAATTLGNTLSTTGLATLNGGLTVNGISTLNGATTVDNNLNVNGNTTVGTDNTNSVTVNAQVASALIPNTDVTHDLGTSALKWNAVYAQTVEADSTTFGIIQIGVTASNRIDTSTGNLIIASAGGTIHLSDNFRAAGLAVLVDDVTMLANATVGGTLGITGDTTVSTMTASGDATFSANIIGSTLTPSRVTYVGASNELVDSANMTFDGSQLAVTDLQVDDININGSTITSSAATLQLTPDVVIAGNLTVTGTTTTVNSTTVTIVDPIFTIGSDLADDNLDRGIEFKWNDGTAKLGFFGWDDSASVFTFIPDATNAGEIFAGAAGNVAFGGGNFTGTVTAAGFSGPLTGNADTASALQSAVNLIIAGDATGTASFDGSADATITIEVTQADAWETARTLTLDGDVTGAIAIDGSTDVTLTATVADDSHSHDTQYYTEAEVDGFLAVKLELASLSVTQNAGSGTGALAYDNGTGIFTYTPPDFSPYLTSFTESDPVVGAVNGIVKSDGGGNISAAVPGTDYSIFALSDLSVTTAAAGTAALSYNNSSGVFTFIPEDVSTFIALTDLSVTQNAVGVAGLAYDNTTGVFSYTPPDLSPYLTAETSHADVVVDGDFASAGIMASDGAGTYSIITDNSANWNTAFGWGDHSVVGYLTAETSHADVLVDSEFATAGLMTTDGAGAYSITTNNSANWNTAFGWGDHSVVGYLTAETSHADVLVDGDFATAGLMTTDGAGAYSITTNNSANWNTAFGWGDHSTAGYLTAETTSALAYDSGTTTLTFTDETGTDTAIDLSGLLDDTNIITSVNTQTGAVVLGLLDLSITDGTAGQILSTDGAGNFSFVDDAGGIALTDLSVTTAAAGTAALSYDNTNGVFTYTPPDLSSYLTAETSHADVLVDGDFATAGLMTTDGAGAYSITTNNSANWNTAFGWGDHSAAGYLTAETTTVLAYTAGTQTLTFTDETGTDTNIDLSGLLDDTNLVTSVNTQTGAVVLALTDLGITDGTNGQILSTDGAGNFSFVDDAGGIALTDLSVTTAAAGTAALAYDNTTGVFTYTPPDLSSYLTSVPLLTDIGNISSAGSLQAGNQLIVNGAGDGYAWVPQKNSVDDLNDVEILSAPTNGEILIWDGTAQKWKPGTAPSSGIELTDLSVTQNAVGTAALSYDNTTGTFSYTPPDLSGKADLAGSTTQAFSASQLSLGADWSMEISGTSLRFFYQSTPVAEINATGQITAAADVIVNGTL